MGRRAKLLSLPAAIRTEVFKRAIETNFSDYEGLEAWLRAEGHEISASALHRTLAPLSKWAELLRSAQLVEQASGGAVSAADALNAITLDRLTESIDQLIGILESRA